MSRREEVTKMLKNEAKNWAVNLKSYQDARMEATGYFQKCMLHSKVPLKTNPELIFEIVARTILYYDFLRFYMKEGRSVEELLEMRAEDNLKLGLTEPDTTEKPQ
jgi:hypothetical protein